MTQTYKPRDKADIADETHAVIAKDVHGHFIHVAAQRLNARQAQALAAWLLVAADWLANGG